MSKVKSIIVGHYNEMMNKNEDIGNMRMEICKRCPLYTIDQTWGPLCNSNMYLNVDTNETSDYRREGFRKGCGCRLNAKTKDKESHCPLQKW